MDTEKYLTGREDTNILRRFAFLGIKDDFQNKLLRLTKLAEPEEWYLNMDNGEQMSVIFYYIIHTFDQCFKQGKLVIDSNENVCFFNTGLLTSKGDEIYGYFTKSLSYDSSKANQNYWYLDSFVSSNDRKFVASGVNNPELVTYFSDYNELYYNPNLQLNLNFDHIYGDNEDRLPESMKSLPIETCKIVFDGFIAHTIKKIKRNSRIPVPQYYKGKVMFLLPINVINNEVVIIAVEKVEQQYIANTVLTFEMAYNCARLLTKPESNWLLIKGKSNC